ncbi:MULTISPECIES: replication initiation protein [Bacteria]|uniref:Replication initiation protein n=5 Tax=Bacteria TaxID=2 RepID=A0A6P0GNP6_9ACTN|nr:MULTISPECIES: replication initiation protein [Bacteria]NEM09008.1 replication initiation protein [Geodermatophilus normandii]
MEQIAVSSAALALRAEKPLTPAMVSALWEIAAILDEERVPANVPNAVWLTIPTTRLRGPEARPDNVWLRECLERMTGLKLTGQHRGGEWGAVLVAEWHITEGGSKARILIPPAGVHALRSPGNFVKIETTAAHRLPPHARRLYALLADRKRQREPYAQWGLDNLRGLLGVDDKRSYDVWAQLAKRVLTPAVEAINDYGTVRVKMTPVKSGRSVAAVRFDWQWKDPHEATETVAENERHSAARRKEQASNGAPPIIEDEEQTEPALTWWGKLRNAEREEWADRVGRVLRTEGPGGKIFTAPRREADIAREAFAEHSERPK